MTSFKRGGTGIATTLWAVSDGKRLFALTDLNSAKVKRIRHDPHIEIASCLVDGKLRREPAAARGGADRSGGPGARAEAPASGYKISYRVVMLFYRLGRRLRGKQSVADGAALAITLE